MGPKYSPGETYLIGVYIAHSYRTRQFAQQFELRLGERVSERTRIARELHDTLLQSLQALLLRFRTVSYLLPRGDTKERLDGAIDHASQAITEGRNAVQGLRETAEFKQAQQVVSKPRALTLEISPSSGIQAHFEALCASPDDANSFAALLQAGLLYLRYQADNSNPDLASMLDQAKVAPSGDRLDVTLALTDDEMMGLIQRNVFVIHL